MLNKNLGDLTPRSQIKESYGLENPKHNSKIAELNLDRRGADKLHNALIQMQEGDTMKIEVFKHGDLQDYNVLLNVRM